MQVDRRDLVLSGAGDRAALLFDQAVDAFNVYSGDPMGLLEQAVTLSPGFAMAHLLRAHLLALATEPGATAQAGSIVEEVKTLSLDERERSHLAALEHLVAGNWTAAAEALDHHNARWPLDLVALQVGHLMDFYRANARDLRDRIARVLLQWSEAVPGHAVVLGMYAFGLEETGDYARAEATGRRAIELEPRDCWAHHAVAHVMEMQGRAADGIAWMHTREPHWANDDNFFKVHNWWHRALFHLDLGESDAVIRIYDDAIRGENSGMALDLVDASALLWRVHLAGHDVGARWGKLAAAWDQHADGRLYPFNDWHAAMAYLGAGRDEAVERILRIYRSADTSAETARWARRTGLPLIEGFTAFWRGNYAEAARLLHGARFIANSFGGSHAQRDVIDWTLTEAALRGGLADLAKALANERCALKPHSPVNRSFLSRARRAATGLAAT